MLFLIDVSLLPFLMLELKAATATNNISATTDQNDNEIVSKQK